MKKILSMLALALTACAFYACSDADTDNPYGKEPSISVEMATVTFTADGGTGKVVLNAPNGVTNVKCTADWITHVLSGTTADVTVEANESIENRYARMTFYSGADSVYVVVHQFGNTGQTTGDDE